MNKKILLVTFSDNSDHQDTMIGMYEQLSKQEKIIPYLIIIKSPKVPFKKDKNVWCINCPKRPGLTLKTFNIISLFWVIMRIKKEKFDIIYFESLHVWNLPIMLFKNKKTKIFHVIHEVIPHEGDKQVKLIHLMNTVICKFADIIVLHNHKYIDSLMKIYHVDRNRIREIDCWRRYPGYTQPTYSKQFLFFGRMNHYKGVDYLLNIVKKCPTLNFSIVGNADIESAKIISQLKKCPNVTITNGYVNDDEMRSAFINADWLILPYKSASQSGVIIDAYKYSRPVVAFNVGAIEEQIEEKNSGYLIPPQNVRKFCDALLSISEMSKKQYDIMSQNAYKLGSKKYAANGAVKKFLLMIFGK